MQLDATVKDGSAVLNDDSLAARPLEGSSGGQLLTSEGKKAAGPYSMAAQKVYEADASAGNYNRSKLPVKLK